MKQSIRWIFVMMLLCSAVALACGGSGDEETTANTAVPAATATSEPEAIPTATAEPTPIAEEQPTTAPSGTEGDTEVVEGERLSAEQISAIGNNFTTLTSYRVTLNATFSGTAADGTIESGTITGDISSSVEPDATSANLSITSGDGTEPLTMNFVELEGTVYAMMAGLGCMSGGAEDMGNMTDPIADFTNPEEGFLRDVEAARYVGEETHNGYVSDCYQFEETDAPHIFNGSEDVTGLLCVSKEFGHLSYLQIHAEGASADLFTGDGTGVTGEVDIEMNVWEVNEPVEISIPEGCTSAADSPWPILEGAQEMVEFAGMIGYSTDLAFDEVVQFYEDEMASLGFEVSGEHSISEGSATLSYTKGDEKVTISIFAASNGEGWQVLITPE